MSTQDKHGVDVQLSPEILLRAYAAGIFPMSDSRDAAELFWVDPEYRGVIPLGDFHIPRRLRKLVRSEPFEIRINSDFRGVMEACAESGEGRTETWINDEILRLYTGLHAQGAAHSVECWKDGELVGGLYGVSLKSAFFGESMFSRRRDASKVALVYLVALLRHGRFRLLDTQFVTDHLRQFGAFEMPRARYHQFLDTALRHEAVFYSSASSGTLSSLVSGLLQSRTQTS
jgi:leucyl/phenylalanyl-tRNA--protein transferase